MTNYKFFEKNTKGRDFVVGDLHGMYTLLLQHLWELDFHFINDRLFSVGDLVDRGPESMEILRLIDNASWFFPVLGNHDQMFSQGRMNYVLNYGQWMADESEAEINHYRELLDSVPLAIEVETSTKKVGIVHADAGRDWENVRLGITPIDRLLWDRMRFQTKDDSIVKNIDKVVVGHSPTLENLVLGNVHFIDSAAFHPKGRLTIINLEDL